VPPLAICLYFSIPLGVSSSLLDHLANNVIRSKNEKEISRTGIVLALAIAPAAQGVTAATLPAGTKASLAFLVE
jgi:hypothetical protein